MVTDTSSEDVFENGAAFHEVEGLENHPDVAPLQTQRFTMELRNIDSIHEQSARLDVVHAVDAADEGGFASAR